MQVQIPANAELIFFGENGDSTAFTATTIFPNWTAIYDKYNALQAPGNVYQVPSLMNLLVKLVAHSNSAGSGNALIGIGGAFSRISYSSTPTAADNSCTHVVSFIHQYAAGENISFACTNNTGSRRLLGNGVVPGVYHSLEIWRIRS